LLDDRERLESLRKNCVAFVKKHCDIPVVESQLRRHYEETFSDDADPAASRRSAVWAWLAAIWSVFVLVMYMQHQMALLWPSIQAQLIEPLLGAGR
jgi:hypothetical protein